MVSSRCFRNQVLVARQQPTCVLEFEPDFERRSSFVYKGQAELKNRRCLNPACTFHGRLGSGNIVRHGFYTTRSGKRRRYRCVRCAKTFSSTKGTPYYRLPHRRATFDTVVALRVEGVSISAISRVEGIAWNTVARWLEKAAQVVSSFQRSNLGWIRCRRTSSRRDSHVHW